MAHNFRKALGVQYEPRFIAFDDGAMSWDYSLDDPFVHRLGLDHGGAAYVIMRFIDLMGGTSRRLLRSAEALGPRATRPAGSIEHILQDLRALWDAYESHMTSLFTFWNIELLLTSEITGALRRAGLQEDITAWLSRFTSPAEVNFFVLEQRSLERIRQRFFRANDNDVDSDHSALADAADEHARKYAFLFAPYNLSSLPEADFFIERIERAEQSQSDQPSSQAVESLPAPAQDPQHAEKSLADLPAELHLLGHLAGQLTFWKTERLDAFALADSKASELYKEAAVALDVRELGLFFAMTRSELEESLTKGHPVVSAEGCRQRAGQYCLVLHEGEINFYRPSSRTSVGRDAAEAESGTVLEGMSGSSGTVTGRVRLVRRTEDLRALEKGEVLVTAMTRVEMGAALDQAAAFVTDEGGIICHAAILAREKGKPCVIGTDRATSVLRDGMHVRVDGDTGVVQVL